MYMTIEQKLWNHAGQIREFLNHPDDMEELKGQDLANWLGEWEWLMKEASAKITQLQNEKLSIEKARKVG